MKKIILGLLVSIGVQAMTFSDLFDIGRRPHGISHAGALQFSGTCSGDTCSSTLTATSVAVYVCADNSSIANCVAEGHLAFLNGSVTLTRNSSKTLYLNPTAAWNIISLTSSAPTETSVTGFVFSSLSAGACTNSPYNMLMSVTCSGGTCTGSSSTSFDMSCPNNPPPITPAGTFNFSGTCSSCTGGGVTITSAAVYACTGSNNASIGACVGEGHLAFLSGSLRLTSNSSTALHLNASSAWKIISLTSSAPSETSVTGFVFSSLSGGACTNSPYNLLFSVTCSGATSTCSGSSSNSFGMSCGF